jgi:hypothetical protein
MAKGKTAQHYASNAKSRAKHIRDNSPGGKYAHSNAYKREHSRARRAAGIMGKGGPDMSKKNGKFVKESLKINRARGGRDRA